MRIKQQGFAIVEVFLVFLVLVVIGGVGFFVYTKQSEKSKNDQPELQKVEKSDSTVGLEIKNWPVKIGAFDASTQLAGDVYMNKQVLASQTDFEQRPLAELGWKRINTKEAGRDFVNPTIDFLTRPGAPLLSVSDGYVRHISHQQEHGRDDYEIHIQPTPGDTTQWLVIYDHLANPSVKEGDKVTAGQRIGDTGPYGSGQPYNWVELQVNYYPDPKVQQNSEGRCPSSFIASDSKQKMADELKLITGAWEAQVGNTGLYNEAAWIAPGCITEKAEI